MELTFNSEVKDNKETIDRVISVEINFEENNSEYEVIEPVLIPILVRPQNGSTQKTFPYVYSIDILVTPMTPYPCILKATCMFTYGHNAYRGSSQFPPISLQFHDIFLPLQLPRNCGKTMKEDIFNHIWNMKHSHEEDVKLSTSVKRLNLTQKDISSVLENDFSQYMIKGIFLVRCLN